MKKNMLIRILSLVVVLACVFAFAGCYDDTEVKNSVESTQTSLEEAKTALNAAIDAVKNTADAAATKTALDEAVAKLEAAMKTSNDAAATKTALEEAKTNLQAAIDAVKNTVDATATKAALEEVDARLTALQSAAATKEELSSTQDALAIVSGDVQGIVENMRTLAKASDVAALQEGLTIVSGDVQGIVEQIRTLAKANDLVAVQESLAIVSGDVQGIVENMRTLAKASDVAALQEGLAIVSGDVQGIMGQLRDVKGMIVSEVENLRTEINDGIGANLTALQTKVGELETSVNDSIETINSEIASLKAALGSIEGTEAGTLLDRVAALEATVAAIDTDAFKKEYVEVTEILLGGEDQPKSFYNFLKIINDNIDFGGYDDESVLAYERRVEEIKFALSRAVTIEEIDKAFVDLAEAEKGLVLLVDALAAKLEEITLINLGEDCTTKIESLKGIYDKIVKKNAKIENADDKIVVLPEIEADYILKTGAYDTLAGFAADKGAQVNGKVHPIFSVNKVLLASDATSIDGATTLIAGLVNDVLGVSEEYFALYTNDVYANLYNIALEEALADLVAKAKTDYVNAGIAAKAEELKNAWIDAEVAAKLAADDILDEAVVRAEVTVAANETDKLAEFAAQASTEVKATLEAEAEAKTEDFKAEKMADAETAATAVAREQAATLVADTLYNKAEYTAVNTRYELLKLAKEDAEAEGALLAQIKAIAGAWLTTRPAYDNSDKQNVADVVALKNAWIADAKYKNDADFGAFTACVSDIEIENVNYILGEDRLLTLADADKYVKAMNAVYADNKVAELIEKIKAAVNGNVDVDNASIDECIAAIATLDAAIEGVSNWTVTQDGTKNKYLMVSEELRDRLTIINKAYDDVLAAIEALKGTTSITYDADTDTWAIKNYEAGKVIATYKNKLSVLDEDTKEVIGGIYYTVLADSSNDNKITSVTSTKGEEVLATVQGLFEEFAKTAIEAYNNASTTIDKIDELVAKNGMLTLDLGDDIYEAINGINDAIVDGAIYGMNFNYTFTIPVDDVMTEVQFRDIFDRLNSYGAQYQEMAESNGVDAAEDVAAELTAAINAIKDYNGAKLQNYNEIVALYNRVINEWVNVYFVNMTPAEAVAATDSINKVVGGGTYAFITNDTFKTIKDKYDLAIKTYAAAEKEAGAWKDSANSAIGSYTFHDWAKFQEIETAYKALTDKYYNNFSATTEPGFGLYAAHETFAVAYGKCETMANNAGAQITAIVDAIKALNALEDITIGNYQTVRTDIKAVKDLIVAFEEGFCANAQNDDDFIVDDVNYNVVLAKADAMVKLFEVGVDAVGTTINNVEITTDYVEQQAGMLRMALQRPTVITVDKVEGVYGSYESYFVVVA